MTVLAQPGTVMTAKEMGLPSEKPTTLLLGSWKSQMFEYFRRRKTPPPILFFKDGASAFEYACMYMARSLPRTDTTEETDPDSNLMVGFVHGEAHNQTDLPSHLDHGGYYDVSLAVEGGPIRIQCGSIVEDTAHDIAGKKATPPSAGDLVLVQIGSYDPTFAPESPVNYFIICFRLKPELDVATGSFRMELADLAGANKTKSYSIT